MIWEFVICHQFTYDPLRHSYFLRQGSNLCQPRLRNHPKSIWKRHHRRQLALLCVLCSYGILKQVLLAWNNNPGQCCVLKSNNISQSLQLASWTEGSFEPISHCKTWCLVWAHSNYHSDRFTTRHQPILQWNSLPAPFPIDVLHFDAIWTICRLWEFSGLFYSSVQRTYV